jgi:hypothetical protein
MQHTETRQVDIETLRPEMVAVMAEFTDVQTVTLAAQRIRDDGYTQWDVHSPFPIHGMDSAMGIRGTILPWLVLGAGLTGMALGLLMQWYMNAYDYQYFISGKPLMSLPAFIPVMFEMTILFAALAAVFGMLLLNRLPMLYNPLLKHRRFRRVTSDRFFIVIGSADPKFDEAHTTRLLQSLGASAIERVED